MAGGVGQSPLLRSHSSGKILVVDDQAEMLVRILPRIFGKIGYNCEIVEHSSQALELIREQYFTGVLMDFEFGKDDPETGESLAKKMRGKDFKYKGFIFSFSSTDNDSEELLERRKNAGMNGVLGKPFHFERFKSLVAEYFSCECP